MDLNVPDRQRDVVVDRLRERPDLHTPHDDGKHHRERDQSEEPAVRVHPSSYLARRRGAPRAPFPIAPPRPGAAGEGFQPLIIAIPWILAAILSLLLVSPRKWIHRRLLLFAGWTATAIVASVGPAALWSVIKMLTSGDNMTKGDINFWVFTLFYTSWFLWAIAGFAATRSYQLRTKKQDFKFPQTI